MLGRDSSHRDVHIGDQLRTGAVILKGSLTICGLKLHKGSVISFTHAGGVQRVQLKLASGVLREFPKPALELNAGEQLQQVAENVT